MKRLLLWTLFGLMVFTLGGTNMARAGTDPKVKIRHQLVEPVKVIIPPGETCWLYFDERIKAYHLTNTRDYTIKADEIDNSLGVRTSKNGASTYLFVEIDYIEMPCYIVQIVTSTDPDEYHESYTINHWGDGNEPEL